MKFSVMPLKFHLSLLPVNDGFDPSVFTHFFLGHVLRIGKQRILKPLAFKLHILSFFIAHGFTGFMFHELLVGGFDAPRPIPGQLDGSSFD